MNTATNKKADHCIVCGKAITEDDRYCLDHDPDYGPQGMQGDWEDMINHKKTELHNPASRE